MTVWLAETGKRIVDGQGYLERRPLEWFRLCSRVLLGAVREVVAMVDRADAVRRSIAQRTL